MPISLQALESERERLRRQLSEIGDMRPGSLVGRYRRCGKPTCHCAADGATGHGPSWSLTRRVDGKTVTKIIPSGQLVERTRGQLAEYERFRQLARQLVETNEQICDLRLREVKSQGAEASKKNRARARTAPRNGR